MTFMDNLAANPSGGVYGQPPPDNQDPLGLVNQIKDREMNDFKNKANFMADLSLKQDKMRAMFDPSRLGLDDNKQPNVVQAQDPNQITGPQKAELGIKQQGLNLESQRIGQEGQKIAQSGRLGQEAIDIKGKQEALNQQKSDQIKEQKQADMQRKIDDSSQKFAAMQAELERKTKAGEDTLQLHRDIAKAAEERHQLEMEKMKHDMTIKDDQFKELKSQHEKLLKQGSRQTQTKTDSQGNKITTETSKGDAADTVNVVGKDGKQYTIPKDKLDDKDADGTPHWKQQDDQGDE